ncbi:hypothetical protein HDV00_011227 [Rhizophlyctis rosea]|nr:hypothetical protein HDV00_011227 [Rhizophlyctis rosea]
MRSVFALASAAMLAMASVSASYIPPAHPIPAPSKAPAHPAPAHPVPAPPKGPGYQKPPTAPKPVPFFDNNVIYAPNGTLYPRQVELTDGTLLVTVSPRWGAAGKPAFPVFQSKDHGVTWKWISNITDQVNGNGMSAQPAIMQLSKDFPGYPKGTILASGNSWNSTSTNIDVYASFDLGYTWKFVSNVARGTEPNTADHAHPIWEPYLLEFGNQIVCYYSDQRDNDHSQKLAHQTTTDLKHWGPVVDDVAFGNFSARPGMTVIAHLPDNNWILVHECPFCQTVVLGTVNYPTEYPVVYHIAKSPLDFRFSPGIPLVANNTQPNASPYVVWTPAGGPHGTIIVSDADHSQVFTNRFLGAPDKWEEHYTPAPDAYSRSMHILKDYPDHLLIIGGGSYGTAKPLTVSSIDVNKLVGNKGPK